MKNHLRFFSALPFVLTLIVFAALALPFPVAAQSDSQSEPLQVGDSVDISIDSLGVTQFDLEADEGQTVALRWEATVPPDNVLKVTTQLTNANGETIPSSRQLDTTTASTQVYTLTGPAPYHMMAAIDDGSNATVTLLDGDPITVAEQAPIGLGETVTGVVPAEGELVVYPLTVQPGEAFTVHVLGVDPEEGGDDLTYPLAFLTVVRDANGQIVEPDARTDGRAYTATDAAPLRLEMARYPQRIETMGSDDAAYNIRLDPGNTIGVWGEIVGQGGLLALGQRIEEDATGIAGDRLFTLDAEEGQTITLHLVADSNYLWDVGRILEFEEDENGIIHTSEHLINPSWAMMQDSSSQREGCVCVYTFKGEGPPPYVLSMIQQINDPHIGSLYAVQVDQGDTLVRNSLGTLTPGGMVQGNIPSPGDMLVHYVLDADPQSTVTVSWGSTDRQFFISEMDGDLVLPINNPWNDGYSVLDLSAATPPFVVNLLVPDQSGTPYTITLAEGTTPLDPGAATLIPNTSVVAQPVVLGETSSETQTGTEPGTEAVAGDTTSETSSTSTTTTAATCTVTASGVNQRSGPGTNFAASGSLSGSASADGQTTGADGLIWYRLTSGVWVRSDVVSADAGCSTLPTVS